MRAIGGEQMSERICLWYIEPCRDDTNEYVCRALGQDVEEESLRDNTGVVRQVLPCPDTQRKLIVSSLTRLGLPFKLYTKEGGSRMRLAPAFLRRQIATGQRRRKVRTKKPPRPA